MTNLKDKLSASVRMAKANQQPAAKADEPATTETAKPAAAKAAPAKPAASKPSPAKSVAKPTPAKAATKKPAASANKPKENQESGSTLFPSRVWPD